MAERRQVRGDCRVGAFEEKNNLPPGTIRNKNGRNTRSDKKIETIRGKAENSKEKIIEQAGLTGSPNLTVENGSVVIKSVGKIREGWAKAAAKESVGFRPRGRFLPFLPATVLAKSLLSSR